MQGERHVHKLRYYNQGEYSIAIVAVVTEDIDWAAYIGVTPGDASEMHTAQDVARFGCKLTEEDARYYFPDVNLPYRW